VLDLEGAPGWKPNTERRQHKMFGAKIMSKRQGRSVMARRRQRSTSRKVRWKKNASPTMADAISRRIKYVLSDMEEKEAAVGPEIA